MNRNESNFRPLMWFIGFLLTTIMAGCLGGGGGQDSNPGTGVNVGLAPMVTFTAAANKDTGVPVNSKLYAAFSEAMDPATITTASFMVTGPDATPVPGSVAYVGISAIFTPANNLAYNTTFTATITTGAKNLAGYALASNYVWIFSTGAAPDTTAPTVSSTGARNGDINLSINRAGTAIFSEPMDPATINSSTFTMTGPGTTPVSGTVTYAGVTATFTPTSNLIPYTLYTTTITTGAKDLAGNALASDYVVSWTTGASTDTTAPTVSSTGAQNGATGLPINRNTTVTFSEQMDPLTITTSTFTLTQGTTPVAGTVTYVGFTATFNPTADLAANTTYTSTITAGVKDLAGNALRSNHVWSWTTGAAPDTTAPTVSYIFPANLATGIAIGGNIAATFSEGMNPVAINNTSFTLYQGATPVAGAVTYVGTTATFNPIANLATNTTYTATITSAAKNLGGIGLLENFVWTFSTGETPDTTTPTVIATGSYGNTGATSGATGLPVNRASSAVFSKPMDPTTITSATYSVTGPGTTPVPGSVTYSGIGSVAIFRPKINFAVNTTFTSRLTTEAKDLAGNPLKSDYVWSWTTGAATDTNAPIVISTNPADLSTGVCGSYINVTFSELMDPLTITNKIFTLGTAPPGFGGGLFFQGVVSYDPITNIATYSASNIVNSTKYYVKLQGGATGVKDMAGNPLASSMYWTFTTGTTCSP